MTGPEPPDRGRARLYSAEALVHSIFDNAAAGASQLTIGGTTVTVPAEARFATVESMQRYADSVLAMAPVAALVGGDAGSVRVRARRGVTAAHYERANATIAVPMQSEARWAQRELVLLHELAHHLDRGSGPAHGPDFVRGYVDLAAIVMGPEAALIMRITFAENGVRV